MPEESQFIAFDDKDEVIGPVNYNGLKFALHAGGLELETVKIYRATPLRGPLLAALKQDLRENGKPPKGMKEIEWRDQIRHLNKTT